MFTHGRCAPPILCTFDNILRHHYVYTPLECLHRVICVLSVTQTVSFLYIQALHNDCSHIEDVHFLFLCTFDNILRLHYVYTPFGVLALCNLCVICNSNSFHSFTMKLNIMIVHTLKICTDDEGPEQSLVVFVF